MSFSSLSRTASWSFSRRSTAPFDSEASFSALRAAARSDFSFAFSRLEGREAGEELLDLAFQRVEDFRVVHVFPFTCRHSEGRRPEESLSLGSPGQILRFAQDDRPKVTPSRDFSSSPSRRTSLLTSSCSSVRSAERKTRRIVVLTWPWRDSGSLVAVHDPHRFEVRELRAGDDALDLAPARALRVREGEVGLDGRIGRERLEPGGAGGRDRVHAQFSGEDVLGRACASPARRRDTRPTTPSAFPSGALDERRRARGERLAWEGLPGESARVQPGGEETLGEALGVEEVGARRRRRTSSSAGGPRRRARRRSAATRRTPAPPDRRRGRRPGRPRRERRRAVPGGRCARPRRGGPAGASRAGRGASSSRGLASDRGSAAAPGRGEPRGVGALVAPPVHEGGAHGLEQPGGDGAVGQPLLDDPQRLQVPARPPSRRQTRGKAVVAVDSKDLFDEVVLDRHVRPPGRNRRRRGGRRSSSRGRIRAARERRRRSRGRGPRSPRGAAGARGAARRGGSSRRRRGRPRGRARASRRRTRGGSPPRGRAPPGSPRGRRRARSGARRRCGARGAARSSGSTADPTTRLRAGRSASRRSRRCRGRP